MVRLSNAGGWGERKARVLSTVQWRVKPYIVTNWKSRPVMMWDGCIPVQITLVYLGCATAKKQAEGISLSGVEIVVWCLFPPHRVSAEQGGAVACNPLVPSQTFFRTLNSKVNVLCSYNLKQSCNVLSSWLRPTQATYILYPLPFRLTIEMEPWAATLVYEKCKNQARIAQYLSKLLHM